MGQAAIDLPDPLQQPSNRGAISADDLLSQLAGEEIDRLLAEAEVEPRRNKDNARAEQVEDAAAAEHHEAPTVPKVNARANEAAAPVAEKPAEPPAAEEPRISPLLLDQMAEMEASSLIAPLVAPEPQPASAEEPASDAPLTAADQGALKEVLSHAEARADGPLPLYLRPLEWLSAPLMVFPESVREALGKVAIITLFNSLAVLLYVLLFRSAE